MKRFPAHPVVFASLFLAGIAGWGANHTHAQGVQIDHVSIGGVVLNTDGRTPEAGVWVIAETKRPAHSFPSNRGDG